MNTVLSSGEKPQATPKPRPLATDKPQPSAPAPAQARSKVFTSFFTGKQNPQRKKASQQKQERKSHRSHKELNHEEATAWTTWPVSTPRLIITTSASLSFTIIYPWKLSKITQPTILPFIEWIFVKHRTPQLPFASSPTMISYRATAICPTGQDPTSALHFDDRCAICVLLVRPFCVYAGSRQHQAFFVTG